MKKITLFCSLLSLFLLAGCGKEPSVPAPEVGGDEGEKDPTPIVPPKPLEPVEKELTFEELESSINKVIEAIPNTKTNFGLNFESKEQEFMEGVQDETHDYKLTELFKIVGNSNYVNGMKHYTGSILNGQTYATRNKGDDIDLNKSKSTYNYIEETYEKFDQKGYKLYSCETKEKNEYHDYQNNKNNSGETSETTLKLNHQGEFSAVNDDVKRNSSLNKESLTGETVLSLLDCVNEESTTYKYFVIQDESLLTYKINIHQTATNDESISTWDDKINVELVLENSLLKSYKETEDVRATYKDGTRYGYKFENTNEVCDFKEFTYPNDVTSYGSPKDSTDMFTWGNEYIGYNADK